MLPDARDFCPNSSCSITVAFSPNIRLICSVISFRVYSNAPEPGIRRDKTHFFLYGFVRSHFMLVCFSPLLFSVALFFGDQVFVHFFSTYFHEYLGQFFSFSTSYLLFHALYSTHVRSCILFFIHVFHLFYSCNHIKLIMLALAVLLFWRSLLFIFCFSCL